MKGPNVITDYILNLFKMRATCDQEDLLLHQKGYWFCKDLPLEK